ncbi:MAG TPA: DUF371 domain-containing protein [Nitrososphaeraceae archaeon]|nr:DUF371 domain-containing protein [Nitrososphaeraceae archaeon]
MICDEVEFYGHRNVLSTHPRTIEITKDDYLTPEGNCIIGIRANKACNSLNPKLQKMLIRDNIPIKFQIIVEDEVFSINGYGNSKFTLKNSHDIVIRTSGYICSRTASILCDKASIHIPRTIVSKLQNPNTKGTLKITVNDL